MGLNGGKEHRGDKSGQSWGTIRWAEMFREYIKFILSGISKVIYEAQWLSQPEGIISATM